ncbi:protein required for attachment to host cells [Thiogranum longum]|uniref:Protein required for attachment to host cells n=1 Tax=Thiogranum longum TaxID=1537524 RepID=A0A4R1HB67_9GAMM|nr:host attachment protein [Thiogranum longum]TCK18618.1 protein required for attachment to host cells [Thiogranum longum]
MSKKWVVVADQSRARIFAVDDPHGPLLQVDKLEHPEARKREQELTSDRPGRSFDSAGQGRHAMGTAVEPKKEEALRFAKQIADYLQAAHREGRFNRLLLVAGPPLLGLLRDKLKVLSGANISEIDKNLGQYEAQEIRSHLPDRL